MKLCIVMLFIQHLQIYLFSQGQILLGRYMSITVNVVSCMLQTKFRLFKC